MRHAERAGWVLLEVLLALAILGVSGTSLATLARQSGHVMEGAARREALVSRAERIMARHASRSRAELESSVGRWTEEGLGVRISRLQPMLFEIVIVQAGEQRTVLETALYRPDLRDAP